MRTTTFSFIDNVPTSVREFPKRRAAEIAGLAALAGVASLTLALLTWSVSDPSLNHATNARVHNLLGAPGAIAADLVMQFIGLASAALLISWMPWVNSVAHVAITMKAEMMQANTAPETASPSSRRSSSGRTPRSTTADCR